MNDPGSNSAIKSHFQIETWFFTRKKPLLPPFVFRFILFRSFQKFLSTHTIDAAFQKIIFFPQKLLKSLNPKMLRDVSDLTPQNFFLQKNSQKDVSVFLGVKTFEIWFSFKNFAGETYFLVFWKGPFPVSMGFLNLYYCNTFYTLDNVKWW